MGLPFNLEGVAWLIHACSIDMPSTKLHQAETMMSKLPGNLSVLCQYEVACPYSQYQGSHVGSKLPEGFLNQFDMQG